MAMSRNGLSTFVMNKLDAKSMQALDDNYPTLDAIDQMFTDAIYTHNCVITARLDKNGDLIIFLNQGEYAVSGRSHSLLDALVIVLYKLQLSGFDLASQASKTSSGVTRG